MRMQHIPKQPILRDHVHFTHALNRRALLFSFLFLLAERRAPDLAQVIVVEYVGEETPAPDYEADEDVFAACGPVVLCHGAVAGEIAADGEPVDDLEGEGHEPDEGVHWGHGGVEVERCKEGAVEVVYDLQIVLLVVKCGVEVCIVRTKHPARVQFPHGSSEMPSSLGRLYMT